MNRKAKKLDLRVQKTYQQLETAFRSLSLEKSPEAFTIQELCDAADIRRTTFYQHFEDKHDFLGWFLLRVQEQYLQQHPVNLAEVHNVETYCKACAKAMIAFMKENSLLIDTLVNNNLPHVIFLMNFQAAYKDELKFLIKRYADTNGILPLFPLDLIAGYYIGAVVSSVLWWYRSRDVYKESSFLEDLDELLRNSPSVLEDKSVHLNQ